MPFGWGRTRNVKCPDGSTKTVYKNVDHVFPLYIKSSQADLAAEAKYLAEAAAKLKAAYANKVQGLLFGLDELTQTIVINFRSVYLVFVSDPCANAGFLQREVEKLVAEQQRLAKLRIQVKTLLELAKMKSGDAPAFLELFQEIAGGIGGASVPVAAQIEITEARQLADKWIGTK